MTSLRQVKHNSIPTGCERIRRNYTKNSKLVDTDFIQDQIISYQLVSKISKKINKSFVLFTAVMCLYMWLQIVEAIQIHLKNYTDYDESKY